MVLTYLILKPPRRANSCWTVNRKPPDGADAVGDAKYIMDGSASGLTATSNV